MSVPTTACARRAAWRSIVSAMPNGRRARRRARTARARRAPSGTGARASARRSTPWWRSSAATARRRCSSADDRCGAVARRVERAGTQRDARAGRRAGAATTQRRDSGRRDDHAGRGQRAAERRAHRRSSSVAATVERELPWAGRTTASWRRSAGCGAGARPQLRAIVADLQRPRRVGVAEVRLHEEQSRAGAQRRDSGAEDRGVARGAQPRRARRASR